MATAVLQTQAYTQHLEAAASAATETIWQDLQLVVQQAQSQFSVERAGLEQLTAEVVSMSRSAQATQSALQQSNMSQSVQATAPAAASPQPPPAQSPQSDNLLADPWAQVAAARGQQPSASSLRPEPLPAAKPFSISGKWGTHKYLDSLVSPEGYLAWGDRALGFFSKDRLDVRKLLLWAERQAGPIGFSEEVRGAM